MTRFEQRREQRLSDPDALAGYHEAMTMPSEPRMSETVWLLLTGDPHDDHGDDWVEGVYKTRAAAERAQIGYSKQYQGQEFWWTSRPFHGLLGRVFSMPVQAHPIATQETDPE